MTSIDKQEVERLREEIRALPAKTPRADKIDTINKVRAFKSVHSKATKAAKGGNVELIQSIRSELGIFYGV